MPHGQSWFSIWFPTFYENFTNSIRATEGSLLHDGGLSWYAHEPIDIQHVLGALFVFAIVVTVAVIAYGKIKDASKAIVPDGTLTVRNGVEVFVGAVYGLMSDVMGPKAAKYFLPLIGTCAFFIFASNVLGMIPGFIPPTSKMDTTAACAIIIFLATHIYGVKHHGLAYFKHFFGPIFKWYALPLMLLMLPIEIISHFARPLSLSVRLMANMAADHMVVGIFLGLAPWFVPVPLMLLGAIVVVVQTLVFCLLSTVYISMAIAHEDH